jgi:hypothetical protein
LSFQGALISNALSVKKPDEGWKYYFYNVVEPGTAGRYGRPAGAMDEGKWKQAMRDNPDANSYVLCLLSRISKGWMADDKIVWCLFWLLDGRMFRNGHTCKNQSLVCIKSVSRFAFFPSTNRNLADWAIT